MFSGKLCNKRSGVSKSGNNYYMISVFCDLPDRSRVQADLFLDEDVYKKVEPIPYDTIITCKCAVNRFGKLYVNDVSYKI